MGQETISQKLVLQKQNLIEAIRLAKAYRGLHDHIFFCKEIIGFTEVDEEVHGEMVDILERGNKKLKMFLLPRGSFKTSINTVAKIVREIIKNSDIRILVDCAKYDPDALKVVLLVKNILEKNETIKWLYGDVCGDRWRDTEITVRRSKKGIHLKEPTLCAGSVEVSHVGFHYDMIFCEDIVNDSNIGSNDQMQSVIEHFKGLFQILEPDGELTLNGTRWHYGDCYGYIIDNMSSEFNICIRKAIENEGKPDEKVYFPARLSKEWLTKEKLLIGSYKFSCQYQNDPINPEDQIFRVIPTYSSLANDVPKNLFLSLTVDPAVCLENRADDTAFNVCGTTELEDIFSLDSIGSKMNPDQIIDTIFYLYKKWGLNVIGIETVAFQRVLKFYLEKAEIDRGIRLPILELKTSNTKSKFQRILALQPYLERRQMFICLNQKKLIDQLRMYPKTPHDDEIDALAYQLQLVRKPYASMTDKKEIEEENMVGKARRIKMRVESYEDDIEML